MLLQFIKHFPIKYAILILPTSLGGNNVILVSQSRQCGLEPRNLGDEVEKLSISGFKL